MKSSLRLAAILGMASLPMALPVGPAAAAPGPVQTFPTAAGPVKITPIYHAAAMIEAGADRIYIDPAKPADIRGLPAGDLILITDIHGDHMDADDIKALSKVGTVIIAPAAVQQTITAAQPLANGASTNWRKWKITAVPMYNIKHVQPNGTPFHTKGRGDGYVLNYGGKNFYFAGDTEGTPEMRSLKDIDVAFIPMNLPYTMTPDEAADAVKAFKPKVVIPYHYSGQDTAQFKKDLDGTGIEVRLLDWYANNKMP
ncbi:MAG TPA: MBL fold metallo-hydrolase [Rhizomicrobium sp.]|nr:MBL fold metallo-hydrolase [Rhizomicrobium sp.]